MSADSDAVAPFGCKYAAMMVTQMDLLLTAGPSRNFMNECALAEGTKNTKVLAIFLSSRAHSWSIWKFEQGCSRRRIRWVDR
jgi:hypothetical protein